MDGIARSYVCYLADGVYCEAGTACASLKKVGEACGTPGSESCVANAYCDSAIAGGTCTARLPVDTACLPSAFNCEKGTTCDSGRRLCTLLLPFGSPCSDSSACQSGSCSNGACGEGFASMLAFLCGGP
jgi:hypothetical protein